jgi:outer membrane protein assembly factor BamE (lipoprotein component of BamABCDE complex)
MKKLQGAGLALAASLALGACGSMQLGREFDLQSFNDKVQRGATTKVDVRIWLGAPASTGVSVESNGDRFEEWTYYRGTGSLPEMSDAKLKMLRIKFDQQGVVRAYEWSGQSGQ